MSASNTSQFIIYQNEDGRIKLDVRFMGETVWLTQALMAHLFNTTPENILMHLKNIYSEAELDQVATTKDFLVVRQEGNREVKRTLNHYNLDAIISVGYRVQSHSATRFRQWATAHLREFIVKGFVLDDERLKNPDLPFDYFEELTRRIQDIRTSEKRFYQKITDIYKRHFSVLKEKQIIFPSNKIGEQQKIADCLSSLDDLTTTQAKKVKALQQHKKRLMQQLFPI